MAKICEYGERLKDMTAQEVMDAGVEHLLTQMRESRTQDGEHCLYNGDGVCCGAAPFLRKHDSDVEGKSWFGVCNKLEGYAYHNHRILIKDIQQLHDLNFPEDWRYLLEQLAINNGLEFNPPEVKS